MKNSVLSSFVFKFLERIMVKGLGLAITVILARLIAPEIYGLLAIIMVFVALAQTFVQSGLATALVQNKDTNESDYSTVFYITFVIAALANVILYFAAPVVARIYKSDALIWPLRALSLTLLVGAFNAVQTAKLQREMRFKETMYCNLAATVFSGAIGIYAASKGMGLWALVIYQSAQQIAVTIAMAWVDGWFPQLTFSFDRAKVLYGYGWKLMVSSLLTSVYNEIRTLIVGYKYTSADLAYYDKGYQFPKIIANTLDVSLQSVMLPVMSREQENEDVLQKMLIKALSCSFFLTTPLMLGLAAIADTMIPLLLGEIWHPCVPLLCAFCVSELMLPFKSTNLGLLKAMGRTDLFMKTEIIRYTLMLIILCVTIFCFDSVVAIAIGYAVSSWIDTYTIAWAVKKLINCSWFQQVQKIWKSLLAGGIMYGVVYSMNFLKSEPIVLVVAQIFVGAIVYVTFSLLMKNEAFDYVRLKLKKLSRHN